MDITNNRLIIAVTVLISVAFSGNSFARRVKPDFSDKSLAGFRIGQDMEITVTSFHGEGARTEVKSSPGITLRSHCYLFEEEETFFIFTVRKRIKKIISAELSLQHKGECKILPSSIVPLETGKGVKLGMRLKDIVHRYGKPDEMEIEKLNKTELEYFAKKNKAPAGVSLKDYAKTFTDKRIIPVELNDEEFVKSFAHTEEMLGIHKTVIFRYSSANKKNENSKQLNCQIYMLKDKLVKIVISQPRAGAASR